MDYTFSTTPAQEALLTWIVKQNNLQKELALTNAQFVQARFPELLAPFAEAYKETLQGAVAQKFLTADTQTQQSVLGLLKVSV